MVLQLISACSVLAEAGSGSVRFNRDIRPILSDKCFHCHGPDEKERKAGLRLDLREPALAMAKSGGIAIVPGRPDQSELVARVLTHDEDEVMPPPKTGKPLSEDEKALLKQWIAEGAAYQGHWAFIAPTRPEVPAFAASKFGVHDANPIDAFIAERLEKEKLAFSPEADRSTLIRRVSLDLIGLPPTPAEVAAFEKDPSPDAYERLVDRLLASRHYGERMAIQWLDFARYADSHGFQTDSSRGMWPWRDWVIRAFNDNQRFDQFTIDQLAGDMLPEPSQEQIIATGFNRNHRLNGEGGIIAEEWQVENVVDRVETTGFTWLALTLNCCRCHDHKYDPISQKEFYQLFAFFNNTADRGTIVGTSNRSGGNQEPVVTVADEKSKAVLAKTSREVEAAKREVAEARKHLPGLMAEWEKTALQDPSLRQPAWTLLEPENVVSKEGERGARLTRQPDGSWLASGPNPVRDTYLFDAPLPANGASAFLLECLPDASLPNQSLGRYSNGNFVLTDFDVYVQKAGGKPELKPLGKVAASYSQPGYDVDFILKKTKGKGWAVNGPNRKEATRALFVLETPEPATAGAKLLLRLRHQAIGGHNIGRFRISTTALQGDAVKLDGSSALASVKAVLEIPPAKRNAKQRAELERYFTTAVDSPVKRAADRLAAKQREHDALVNNLPSTMVMQELPQPRDTFVLNRGEYDKPGEKVTAGLPAALPSLPAGAPLNRLALAKWIVDPANPLTARVWVNRAWEKFFGIGLVKTSENFGSQAEWPSHPELLDWLASEFVRVGWDMKAMQKLIVMSAAYRQQSRVTPELLARDPENRLLARGPRFRLTGELIRDQALAVSGLLVPQIGGPSVRPYMPEGVWDETSKYGDLRGYKADQGEGLYRRTMYTIWKRTAAPPTMLLFDAATREVCSVKRSRTNTPLQALALLNEVTFVEAARAFAERMIKEGGATAAERITHGYQLATARRPEAAAVRLLTEGLDRRLAEFRADPDSAARLIAAGQSKPDAAIPPAELAAYTVTASVLLNLDRTITRD